VSPGPFDGVSGTSLDTEVGNTFSFIDNLTMIRGRHSLKTGVDIRRIQLNNSGNTLTTSSISYASADDFINNKADSATYLQGEGGPAHVSGGRGSGRKPPHFLPGLLSGRVQSHAEPHAQPGPALRVLLGDP